MSAVVRNPRALTSDPTPWPASASSAQQLSRDSSGGPQETRSPDPTRHVPSPATPLGQQRHPDNPAEQRMPAHTAGQGNSSDQTDPSQRPISAPARRPLTRSPLRPSPSISSRTASTLRPGPHSVPRPPQPDRRPTGFTIDIALRIAIHYPGISPRRPTKGTTVARTRSPPAASELMSVGVAGATCPATDRDPRRRVRPRQRRPCGP